MKILIMGCGRVGAHLAGILDAEGHSVTILDINDSAFRRLSPDFKGTAMVGDGTDEETLTRAGIKETDAFIAVTQGDNRNVMASQIARVIFNVPKVLCRIYDPLRREIFTTKFGLEALSPTLIFAQMLKEKLESRD